MHTSTRLISTDFQFWRTTTAGEEHLSFAEFCPNYHELDRVGVVSLHLEEGVCQTGRTLLALTTAFYDSHRRAGGDFFDYPQHFAFVGVEAAGLQSGTTHLPLNTPHLWDAWSWLDVWPANKWITAQPTATAMLQCVFDYQITRLFWPRPLRPREDEALLPDYAYKMLRSQLRSIYLYDPLGECSDSSTEWAVHALPAAETLLHESLAKLPNGTPCLIETSDRFQRVAVDQFINRQQQR